MSVQISKFNRAFTWHTCVKSKFPLVFNQLHEEMQEIISKQDGQLISPTTCEAQPLIQLSTSAPTTPLIIQVSPKPLSPSAPLLTSLVAPTPSIIHPRPNLCSKPQPPTLKNQLPSNSPQQISQHVNSICMGEAKMRERALIVHFRILIIYVFPLYTK